MAGNLKEWGWDWYDYYYYGSSPATDPRGPDPTGQRISRGGNWGTIAIHLRCAHRAIGFPAVANFDQGFRCVRHD